MEVVGGSVSIISDERKIKWSGGSVVCLPWSYLGNEHGMTQSF